MTDDAKAIAETVRRIPMAPVLYSDVRKTLRICVWPAARIKAALADAVKGGLLIEEPWTSPRGKHKVHLSYRLPKP